MSPAATDVVAPAADHRPSRDALRALWWPITVSSVLSVGVGLADSLAIAGLATYLASGIVGGSTEVLGIDWLSDPWVILALSALTFGLNIANTLIRERVGAEWDIEHRRALVDAFESADYPVQASESGAGVTVALEQSARASQVIGDLISIINGIARTVIMMGVAFMAAWQVSLATVIAGTILVTGMRQLSKRTRRMNRVLAGQSVEVGEYVGDVVGSVREIHLLDRWGSVNAWIEREMDRMFHLRFNSRVVAGLVGPIFAFGTILVGLLVGVTAGRTGTISTSAIATSGILLLRSLGAAQSTQVGYQSFHDALPYMDRVLETIARLQAAARTVGDAHPGASTALSATDVHASYGRDTVLRGISLDLRGPGGVAIVGPSGGGKSTFLLALSGLVPPDRGAVQLEGIDLRTIDCDQVGGSIGYLAQDPKVLRGDLRSNLTRPEVDEGISEARIAEVLDQLALRETVESFRDGWEAQLGRAGEGFSGGELQRLGLARLLLNDPAVWLLDEPTSALDRRNSERVTAAITEAMDDHLVVVVTHRPELLAHCQRLVFVEDGEVVDDGTVAEVGARQPFVAAMLSELGHGPADAPAATDAT